MTATSTRLTIPRFRNTTRSNSPAVFPHNLGGCLRAAVPSSGGVRMPPCLFVPKLRHLLGRKRLIMEGLGRRYSAFGPIVETTIPMNDCVCWLGDGVSCASDFHLRFYGRFADLHKLHALHARLPRPCAQGQWPYGENRIGRHCEGMQRSQGGRVVSLDSSRPGAGVGQFMRFFSTEGTCRALSCASSRSGVSLCTLLSGQPLHNLEFYF